MYHRLLPAKVMIDIKLGTEENNSFPQKFKCFYP